MAPREKLLAEYSKRVRDIVTGYKREYQAIMDGQGGAPVDAEEWPAGVGPRGIGQTRRRCSLRRDLQQASVLGEPIGKAAEPERATGSRKRASQRAQEETCPKREAETPSQKRGKEGVLNANENKAKPNTDTIKGDADCTVSNTDTIKGGTDYAYTVPNTEYAYTVPNTDTIKDTTATIKDTTNCTAPDPPHNPGPTEWPNETVCIDATETGLVPAGLNQGLAHFRRKARRKLGKRLKKRPAEELDVLTEPVKKRRTDHLESYLEEHERARKEREENEAREAERLEEMRRRIQELEEKQRALKEEELARLEAENKKREAELAEKEQALREMEEKHRQLVEENARLAEAAAMRETAQAMAETRQAASPASDAPAAPSPSTGAASSEKENMDNIHRAARPTIFKETAASRNEIRICVDSSKKACAIDINRFFQEAKKEHIDKINNTVIMRTTTSSGEGIRPKPTFGTTQHQPKQPLHGSMRPHTLYKQSIDAQSPDGERGADPGEYVPRTEIPFYESEEEFASKEKRFEPARFTTDPKLGYLVRKQNHDEIRRFFGNKKEIDVETIFRRVENVTNWSPNKFTRKT